MATFKGCTVTYPNGRTVPMLDTELEHLIVIWCASAECIMEVGVPATAPEITQCWLECYTQYLAAAYSN